MASGIPLNLFVGSIPLCSVSQSLIIFLLFFAHLNCLSAERPNIIWIISDDLGPELGCYDYQGVSTPNLDRLAQNGIRYSKAFSTSPVCSASRTAFQTGHYQTYIGGHHHDTRIYPVLTAETPSLTELMQKAGYFVSNGIEKPTPAEKLAKSHLNFRYDPKTFFDGSDWSQRKAGQPFFAQIQIREPHRPFHQSNSIREKAKIPPYYPDHPITRADWNAYLSSIEILDQKVGTILERLHHENLTDNTLIIFFGDHGRPHVRGKQWLYDGGIHVPLIISWPSKLAAKKTIPNLVSLIDLMPTTLAAAGVLVPDSLPGLNLLARDWTGHPHIFAARDRCGDASDRIRAVRDSKFKYIRNFHPELPYLQYSSYKKLEYPVETLMKYLHAEGKWNSPFMAAQRPTEELYDLSSDPYEMTNLASDPNHTEQLKKMRSLVNQWIIKTKDQGEHSEWLKVDQAKVMAEKKRYYEKKMRARGLHPALSDLDYLRWWEKQLQIPTTLDEER